MNHSALIIMAKEPKIGSTKTRLCPPLSLEEAADFYEALLLDTIDLVSRIQKVDLAIAVTPPDSTSYFVNISPKGTLLIPVECEDIGQCLSEVLASLLKMGYSKASAINSDGPTIPNEYIQEAFDRLNDHDLVFGPAEDGGYYLVGLKELQKPIFTGIDWSTSFVLKQTMQKCRDLGLKVDLLPSWYDVDTAADIKRLSDELWHLPDQTAAHSRTFLESRSWMRK